MPEQIQSPRSRVLLVDDAVDNLKLLRDALAGEGYELLVAQDGESALETVQATQVDLVLLDISMPGIDGLQVCRKIKSQSATADIPVIFLTASDPAKALLDGFDAGAVDYIGKPFAEQEVLARVRAHLELVQLRRRDEAHKRELREKNIELESTVTRLQQEIQRRESAESSRDLAEEEKEQAKEQLGLVAQNETAHWGIKEFVGQSPTMTRILDDVRKLQGADVSGVLILGESGTGKELVARAIHHGSSRSTKRFVAVNCGAVPLELAESAFFGHVKGSFTGAHSDRKGYFELADGGTLFLDEVGEMPLSLQVKLLRVLETGTLLPVGAGKERTINVRVLAATNVDFQESIDQGSFRSDLYFRLARLTVEVPPLRKRKDDVSLLSKHFIQLFADEMGIPAPRIHSAAAAALSDYDFPGNVRELKNMLEAALIRSEGRNIQPEHLSFISPSPAPSTPSEIPPSSKPFEELPSASAVRELRLGSEENRIVCFVERYESIGNQECRSLLNVNIDRASYLLKKLRQQGILKRVGGHRGARYILNAESLPKGA